MIQNAYYILNHIEKKNIIYLVIIIVDLVQMLFIILEMIYYQGMKQMYIVFFMILHIIFIKIKNVGKKLIKYYIKIY
ncbi:ORF MSV080 hypothetical protein [Melanoplus sanguinipes entomopoxvirus]|uniref:Uncharacterized protein n=1 Tax=Melanoplus sanguinipes entomopoxvirus TaxID=83191 RepID=Q9YW12_MSEPV|nr:ORF MSV080 hypothetical protein [Melanoplus sanguinipes entomopoxvirus]AAC97634.1 ORF MSV080 hypothetical protein [Melanoplus sanguinipes entomopoxvirus 'O']